MTHPQLIQEMIAAAPTVLDLTSRSHLDQVRQEADAILAQTNDLAALENQLIADKENVPLSVHLAVKLAKSKQIISAIHDNVHLSIIFAVYKEHERIRKQSDQYPFGENFLLRKIEQLHWLLGDTPNFSWNMIVVDDGCPDGSGKIAQEILAENGAGDNVRVLFLADAIAQDLPVIRPMQSTNDSRKGGSIEYGMWTAVQTPVRTAVQTPVRTAVQTPVQTAAQQNKPNHIILFTDADLSTHLGQTGLLVDGILNQGKEAAIGSRRETNSIVVKKGTRNTRGKLFIYLWKRVICPLNYIVDTQCGFKAFKAETVQAIVEDMLEKQFAFDIELLLKTELRHQQSITKIGIGWIDSEALSTTTNLQPYLSMLQSMVKMYHKYLPPQPEADAFAAFIESLDEAAWHRLVAQVPEAIAGREPLEFATFNGVTVADLQAIL